MNTCWDSMLTNTRALFCALLLAALPWAAWAHGILIDAESDGSAIWGVVYFSNGDLGAGQTVALRDLKAADAQAVEVTTDTDGKFRFDAVAGHRYRLSAYGDEGHNVELELTADADARPTLIEGEAPHHHFWPPPAWAVIGVVLTLSLVPAWLIRRRAKTGAIR